MTDESTLVEWLSAQLDADEQVARKATSGPWEWQGDWSAHDVDVELLRPDPSVEPWQQRRVIYAHGEHTTGFVDVTQQDAAHIARWDPARVLAEVEAKRAMLALHERHVQRLPFADLLSPTGQRLYSEYAVTCSVCGWASSDPTSACETLRLLALPYADRAGYREEWKL